MKTKSEKRVNRRIRKLNKQLREDVFGLRFYVRQVKKQRNDGISYFLIEFCDNEQPERNKIDGWYNEFNLLTFHELEVKLNPFIIESDFWSKYGDYQKQLKNSN